MRNYGSKHQTGTNIVAAVVLLPVVLPLSVQVQSATVMGSDRYSARQVEEFSLTGRWGKNLTHAYFSGESHPHIQIPSVEDYKVVFHNPPDVEVIICEKSIAGYVSYMSSFMYFSKSGVVVENSGSQLPGVPRIAGMESGRVVLYCPLPADDKDILEEIPDLTRQLLVYDIVMNRIQYDSHGQAILFTGMVKVITGDHTNIDGRTSTPNGILKAQPQLTEINGIMKLDDYPGSSSGIGITFKEKWFAIN